MRDPYLKEYDAYLNSLDRFSAPERAHPYSIDKGGGFQVPLRALAVLGAVLAATAFIPWRELLL